MQRNKPVLIAAVILGLLAIGLTVMSLVGGGGGKAQPEVAAVATPQPRKTQIVANRLIPARTLITRGMVREEESTDTTAPLALDAVVGKLASDLIEQGAVIKSAALADPIKRTKPANFVIPTGLRAVAVMIDATQTNGDIIDVGDHIDVVVTQKLKTKNEIMGLEGEQKSARTIAQNLVVLATDPALKQAPTPAPPGPNGEPGAPAPTPTPPPPPPPPGQAIPKLRIILAAPPAEAARIIAAEESGNIHLILRDPNSGDESLVPEAKEYPGPSFVGKAKPVEGGARATARPAQTFNDYPQPTPPQLPPMPTTGGQDTAPAGAEVTVIRGTEKTRVIVPAN